MRILLLASKPSLPDRPTLVEQMRSRWQQRGASVVVADPDEGVLPLDLGPVPEVDLVVLKSGSELALSWAGALSTAGLPVANPHWVAEACRDKVQQTALLRRAGLPVPESWATSDPRRLGPLVRHGPLVVKTPRGSRGRGIHVVTRPEQLDDIGPVGPWLVMRYHLPEGDDLKCYRIGDEVFVVERPFPAATYAEKVGRPAPVDQELRDLVMSCGEVFGIEAYGVDVVRSAGRRWVVDMSAFPGFKGVPEAGRRLADHLHDDGLRIAAVGLRVLGSAR